MLRRSFLATACVALLSVGAVAAQSTQGTRHIVLAGAPNFRDIGGYKTVDGRTMRWGLLYRSGELSQLTDADYQKLATLGISAVCDFRRSEERQADPTHWKGSPPPEFVTLPNPPPPAEPPPPPVLPTDTAADVRARIATGYRELVTLYAPSFRLTFQRILTSTSPLLYHCTAGKDRTGLFTALLLTFLGVPRATVEEDYQLSNTYRVTPQRIEANLKTYKASREAVVAGMTADASHLGAAFEEIDATFGSLDNYRRTQLGLSDADVVRLKAKLLEP